VLERSLEEIEASVEADEGYAPRRSRLFGNVWDWLPTAVAFLAIYGLLIGFYTQRWYEPLGLLLSQTTTSGGDTGAHHYPAQYLIQELLPHWRLTGWAPGWYAGMPMLSFYFPFPFLLIALLSYILPYTVAFKLVTALGVFLLPLSAYGMARLWRIRRPYPVIAAVFAAGFLLMEKSGGGQLYSIYGGNILSTLAGEFGYMLSFALLFLFLGTMYRGIEKPRLNMFFVLNCLLLMALTLSHIVTTMVLVAIIPGLLLPRIVSSRSEGARLGMSEMGYLVALVAFLLCFVGYLRSNIPMLVVCVGVLVVGLSVGVASSRPDDRRPGLSEAGFLVAWVAYVFCIFAYLRSSLLGLGAGGVVLLLGLAIGIYWPILRRRSSETNKALGYLLAVGVIGFCLVAFWALPFAINLKWTAKMAWDQLPILGKSINHRAQIALLVVGVVGFASAIGLGVFAKRMNRRAFPLAAGTVAGTLIVLALICLPFLSSYLLPGSFIPFFVLGILGMAFAVARGEVRLLPLAWLTVVAFVMYAVLPDGKSLWNGRLLSFWYFSFYIWSAYGVTWLVRCFMVLIWDLLRLGTDLSRRVYVPVVAIIVVACVAATSTVAGGWIRWNYTGYEGKPAWTDYRQILDYIDEIGRAEPHARVMVEHGDKIDQFGTPRAFEIIPYWTQADTMEGTLMEASITAPFHFINQRELSEQSSNAIIGVEYPTDIDVTRGITHLQLMNIPYFLAFYNDDSTERVIPAVETDPRAELLATFGDYKLYHIKDCSGYVEIMKNEPVRLAVAQDEWQDAAVQWYKNADALDTPLVWDNGDEVLKQFDSVTSEEAANPPETAITTAGTVTNVKLENESLSFDTTAIGVPHWIKISYFPNWHVKGAEGPYLASPSMMMVIPTQSHVELYYGGTKANTIGQTLEVIAWALLLAVTVWRVVVWWKRKPKRLPEGSDDGGRTTPPALPGGQDGHDAIDSYSGYDEEDASDYLRASREELGDWFVSPPGPYYPDDESISDFEEDPPRR
jgi:hypothetical protein